MAMPIPRYTSDIDAAQLTLVRSLENLQKALPDNRRHSKISTLSFELNQELGTTNTVTPLDTNTNRLSFASGISTETFRRFEEIREDDDSYIGGVTSVGDSSPTGASWKKYLRPSEILALERQMESLHQDMRDLEGARRRRYQDSPVYASSNQRRLRRVNEVVPQKRAVSCLGSQYSGSLNGPEIRLNSRISAADEDPDVGLTQIYPIIDSSNPSRAYPSSNGHIAKGLPHNQEPTEVRPAVLPSRNHLSKPITQSRPFSAPEFMLPLPLSLFDVSSSLEITQSSQYETTKVGGKAYNKAKTRGSPVRSNDINQSRRSSIAYKVDGRKPQSIGEKKVRFAEDVAGVENSTHEEVISLVHSSSTSSLSSSSRTSSIISVSIDITPPRKENPGLFDTHSLSSVGDEEIEATTTFIPPQAPSGSPNLTSEEKTKTHPTMEEPEIQLPMTKSKQSGLTRFFSRNRGRDGGVLEKANFLRRGPSAPGNASNILTTSLTPLPENPTTHRPRPNTSTNTPIRSLLRKHSESLLSRFSWRGNKSAATPEVIPEETTGLVCVVCRDTFDESTLTQVPGGCLHSYCKGCLKTLFARALDDPHNSFPVKCCGSTTIDISLASALLSSNKIARYKELTLERETVDKVYCCHPRCNQFIPPANIKANVAKCRKCRRSTCTHCKKEKHQEVCKEDQESMDVIQTGKEQGWVQCHRCQHLVERTEGCPHITCVCGAEFCYLCGKEWSSCLGACTSPV